MEMKLIEEIKIRCEQNTSCINSLEGSLLINGLVQIEKYLFFFFLMTMCVMKSDHGTDGPWRN